MTETSLLRAGDTCWRRAHADRAAFLIDGEQFFSAVADALESAQQSIWLLGWDFHSGVRLRRDESSGRPNELVTLIDALVRERNDLHVRVLEWDFAMLYALEREFLPLLQFGKRTHCRIHFATDSSHPVAACQHQKLVLVDDSIAFVGGFDLTTQRWDTREHRPDDPGRVTPSGRPYQPFHDAQIAVDGEAATLLGELARMRWERATGQRVETASERNDAWPSSLRPDVRDLRVGIARTLPSHLGEPEVREVAALYRESIAAARRWIYIENQYLTSSNVGDWIAARLREADGPEVVIVGPRGNSGWLEENTMGALRDRVVRRLRAADRHGRLRVLYPERADLPADQMINVHSKVMVIDDDFARIGSSNLSNRSLGVDTECDLAFEADGHDHVRRAIARLRDDLLAEHLGTTPDRVATCLEETASLIATLERLDGGVRSLEPLELEASDLAAEAIATLGTIDPEHPIPLEELVTRFEERAVDSADSTGRSLTGFIALLALVTAVAAAWQFTSLGDWMSSERSSAGLVFFQQSWFGAVAATAAFALACILLVPVTALTVTAGLALGPAAGFTVAWTGATIAAALGYAAGRLVWRDTVRHLAGRRLNALSERLARRGILSSALLRVLPIAPFTVVNLVAGASHVGARDFVVGTALGILPGTAILVLAAEGIKTLVSGPGKEQWPWVAFVTVIVVGLIAGIRRSLRRRARLLAKTSPCRSSS